MGRFVMKRESMSINLGLGKNRIATKVHASWEFVVAADSKRRARLSSDQLCCELLFSWMT